MELKTRIEGLIQGKATEQGSEPLDNRPVLFNGIRLNDRRSDSDARITKFKALLEKEETDKVNQEAFAALIKEDLLDDLWEEGKARKYVIIELAKAGKAKYLELLLTALPKETRVKMLHQEYYPYEKYIWYDHSYQTPIKIALIHGKMNCVELLIAQGAALITKEVGKQTLMDYAKEGNCESAFQQLLEKQHLQLQVDPEYEARLRQFRSYHK